MIGAPYFECEAECYAIKWYHDLDLKKHLHSSYIFSCCDQSLDSQERLSEQYSCNQTLLYICVLYRGLVLVCMLLVQLQLILTCFRTMLVRVVWLIIEILSICGTQVFLDQGTVVREHGTVYINTDDRFLSLFHKVAIPKFTLDGINRNCYRADGATIPSLKCRVKVKSGGTCPPDQFEITEMCRKHAILKAHKRISMFDALADFKHNESVVDNRKKRGILGVLGLGSGLISMLFSGVAAARLNSHIKKVENDFANFKKEELTRWERSAKVIDNNFRVIDYTLKAINSSVHTLTCTQIAMSSRGLMYDILDTWKDILDNFFVFVNEGYLGGKLTSRILTISDLELILEQHSELKDTAYNDNLMNFYLTSKIIMLSAELSDDQNYLVLHFVIVAPMIYSNNAFPLFEVDQVPIQHKNACLKTVLPEFMFKSGENFVGLSKTSCVMGELVSLCYEKIPDGRRNTCLTKAENCTFERASCEEVHYIYSFSGVLVSGSPDDDLLILNKNVSRDEKKIATRKFSAFGVCFIAWEEAAYVQYKGLKIESPDHIVSVTWMNYTANYTLDWSTVVERGSFKSQTLGHLEALGAMGIDADALKANKSDHVLVIVSLISGILGTLLGLLNLHRTTGISAFIFTCLASLKLHFIACCQSTWNWCICRVGEVIELGPVAQSELIDHDEEETEGPCHVIIN